MKRKAEIAALALAAMFVCFSLGYFTGQRSSPSSVTVSTLIDSAQTEEPVQTNVAAAFGDDDFEAPDSPPALPEPSAAPEPTPVEQTPEVSDTAVTAVPNDTPAETTPPSVDETPNADTSESHYDAEGRLRINLATQKELETLPGIGEVLAGRIIDYRETNGAFKKLTTLKSVSGIGDKRYDAIKDLVTVD